MERNYNILSTAILPAAASALFPAHALSCDEFPFIRTTAAVSAPVAAFIRSFSGKAGYVIFTSVQAVAAVISCLDQCRPAWQVFCISGATRAAVQEYFGAGQVAGYADDAVGLLQHIEQIPPQEMVFFCGSKRLDTVPVWLKSKGFGVQECKVYDTMLTPVKLECPYDAILFFSPSGVKSYLSANEIGQDTILFSIGKTTAEYIQQRVNNKVVIAGQPDKGVLVQTVIDFYNKHKR